MAITTDSYGTLRGTVQNIVAYIAATGNDTTAAVNGPAIHNLDGRISRVAFTSVVTNKTGTSPTLQVTLQGSQNGTNWYNELDASGSAIQTTALSISGTDGTDANTAMEHEDTNQEGISSFSPYLRLRAVVGGSASPGWTGQIQLFLQRK